jgi:imidazolonepropionase-like amidohydrolase
MLILIQAPPSGFFSQGRPDADLLLVNARVITMNPTQPSAEAIAIQGERIRWIGTSAEARRRFANTSRVIDLQGATVLPGLIDAHTHMFNNRNAKMTAESSMLIAVQNVQSDLRAGFTSARDMSSHGNGYADVVVRDAINQGRETLTTAIERGKEAYQQARSRENA